MATITSRSMKWKGNTYQQLMAKLQKNTNTTPWIPSSMYHPLPIKHYRYEIPMTNTEAQETTPSTFHVSITTIQRPQGSMKTTMSMDNEHVIVQDTKSVIPQNLMKPCQDQSNALRRVRTKGYLSTSYNSDTKQYLQRKQKSFDQHTFHFTSPLDTNMTGINAYLAQGGGGANLATTTTSSSSSCFYSLKTATFFQYQWIDGLLYTVPIPIGEYTTSSFQQWIEQQMLQNQTYLVNEMTQTNIFLVSIVYNMDTQQMEITCQLYNQQLYDPSQYTVYPTALTTLTTITDTVCPTVILTDSLMCQLIGFPTEGGTYPNLTTTTTTMTPTDLYLSTGATSITSSSLYHNMLLRPPPMKVVYYKPNNSSFATQGAVDSSTHILRKHVCSSQQHMELKKFPFPTTPIFPKNHNNTSIPCCQPKTSLVP